MNILRLILTVNPEYGGPIQGLLTTSREMAKQGHTTDIATVDDPAADYVRNFPFKVHALNHLGGRYAYSPAFSRWVAENAGRYDVAVIHGLWNHAAVGAWAGLRKAGIPYVVYTHGMMDPWFRSAYPMKHWAKQLYWWTLQGRVLRDARAVLFTSEEERQLSRGVFGGPSYVEKVVAYGSEEPAPSLKHSNAFLASMPQLASRPYLLFLSRIHPKKGCDLLVDAFGRLAREHRDIDVVIAGPDQVGLRSQLEQRAAALGVADRIHWPGMVQGEVKWGAYQGAEALILPSHQENFGIVVAEAMACGTPVLISDKVNIWREVQETGGGLIEPDTVEGTYELMSNYLALSPTERAAMRQRARAGYEARFGLKAAASDLEAALLEISATSRL